MATPFEPGSQPRLRSRRLWLSPFVMGDAEAVFAYASDPEVSRHTTWLPHTSVEEVLRWAFATFADLQEVRTGATAANAGSRRVLEKCGFEYSGMAREDWDKFDRPVELATYVLTREGWEHGLRTPSLRT